MSMTSEEFIEQARKRYEEQRAASKAEATALRAELLAKLHAAGILRVSAEFDGSGDSGAINVLRFFNALEPDSPEAEPPESLIEEVDSLFYAALEDTDVDWYNNDGGYGEIAWNVTADEISIEMNQRFTDSIYRGFTF
jgi:hypothetical protein